MMEDKQNIFEWLSKWYLSQCDGEWEHEYGISIYTVDNPGWSVEIDLAYTELEELQVPWDLVEVSEHDWYGIKVENKKFTGAGDPTKLLLLIYKFRELVESAQKSK